MSLLRWNAILVSLVLAFAWTSATVVKPQEGEGFNPSQVEHKQKSKSEVVLRYTLYRRSDVEYSPKFARVLLVGDVFLGRGITSLNNVLSFVERKLVQAPLVVGNLEGVVEPDEYYIHLANTAPDQPYRLTFPKSQLVLLQRAGFDLMSLANNHALDAGGKGREETSAMLNRLGIGTVGVYPNQIVYQALGKVTLAFLAFNTVPIPGQTQGLWKRDLALQAVSEARQNADGVIVLMHWGEEFGRYVSEGQRTTAQALINAGADLIIGHHPHVLQESEIFQTSDGRMGFVAYSLGNFLFDQWEARTRRSAALLASFDQQGLVQVEALPLWAGGRPQWMELQDAAKSALQVRPRPQRFIVHCNGSGCEEVQFPSGNSPYKASGVFAQGDIDLNGDGLAEHVTLREGRLSIWEGEQLQWQTPADWRILDAALGDPNQDGRFEILTALDRPNENGVLQSHPFILGHRGGRYRDVWGGSAVAHRILEVELADVDGDGEENLVVIEEFCPAENYEPTSIEQIKPLIPFEHSVSACGQRAVSVWEWNGWGFSLFWRSPLACWENLHRCSEEGTRSSAVCVERLW